MNETTCGPEVTRDTIVFYRAYTVPLILEKDTIMSPLTAFFLGALTLAVVQILAGLLVGLWLTWTR